jgi:hypothetical protein
VGGADEYEQMMGEAGEGFIFDKTANDGICLEGCQLARAAGGIALAGGLVAMLLQCYRCAKSRDSGEEQTVSAPPMNEKREPAAPAAEPETEPEAEAEEEEPGFVGKLSSFLFGVQEPVAESEGVVVEADEAEAMGEQGELAPEGVEGEAMWEQEELEPEC